MKEQSRRARRMARHHKSGKQPALNLVSLMDIFTILVFFLLVNSSSTQQLPSKKDLSLPTSTATKAPRENFLIVVTPESLVLQGQKVLATDEIAKIEGNIIEPLKRELEFLSANSTRVNSDGEGPDDLTIMADENIPYESIKKIITSSQHAGFTDISFAASQVAIETLEAPASPEVNVGDDSAQ